VKEQVIDAQGRGATYAVVFDPGDEVMAGLLDFATRHDLGAAQFTAIGVFSDVTFGYLERATGVYKRMALDEQVEVLALVGNISRADGAPEVHAHVTVGRSDGTARGGHLLEAHVWPTLEVMVVAAPHQLRRAHDPETGQALIRL